MRSHRLGERTTRSRTGEPLGVCTLVWPTVSLPAHQVCDLLGDGQLVSCLAQHAPDDGGHYICYLSRKQLPARIREFVDYMIEHTRALDLLCLTTMTALSTVE